MASSLTNQEERELNSRGRLVRMVPNLDTQPFMAYHDPITGQGHARLPADAISLRFYLQKGLAMGPASPELKMKWEAGAPERNAKLDRKRAKSMREKQENTTDDKDARISELETQLEEAKNHRLGIQGKLL